jgi:hypothetical protein
MSNPFVKSTAKGKPNSKSKPSSSALAPSPSAALAIVHSPQVPVVHQDWPDDEDILLEFGDANANCNHWCLKDAFEGVQVFGGTGSGKTSGSGKALAKAFIESNLGGLVLTAKRDEAAMWQEYARKAGREDDLVIFPHTRNGRPEQLRFNFLRYAFQREKGTVGKTENLVNLFCSVLEVADRKSGGGGSGNDGYWQRATKQLLRNAIDLCILASGSVDLENLHDIVASAPQSLQQVADRTPPSLCLDMIELAETNANLNQLQRHDLKLTRDFWEKEFPALAHETRSGVVSMFTSMADCFLRGTLYDLFCTDLNIYPEDCWEEGKIIILDLPVKDFYELGQFAQVIFKYLWQRAVERRVPLSIDRKQAQARIRPVFLWADEAQFFANSFDAQFQSTARSSRACTVYLTQNLPSYHSVFGGANARSDADMFLGNLVTKIFHANGDSTTNQWAADTIGKERQVILQPMPTQAAQNSSIMPPASQGGFSTSLHYAVEPQTFTMLRRGGPPDFLVDGVIFQGGRTWDVDRAAKNYVFHSFDQTI